MKRAVLILAVAVLVVEGYLTYRYYDRYYLDDRAGIGSETAASRPAERTAAEKTEEKEAERTTGNTKERMEKPQPGRSEEPVLHRATDRNTFGNSTYLDVQGITGNRDAVLMVERSRGPGGRANGGHEIGVWYDAYRGGKWAIFNQDREPVPEGSAFEVVVLEGPRGLVHRAEPGNTAANGTFLEDPRINGKPGVSLDVTQNWNPGGLGGTYNDHPVGVRYDPDREGWEIFNKDGAAVPDGSAFNVAVSSETS